jgi:plastocyanin
MLRRDSYTTLLALVSLIACGESITPPEGSANAEGELSLAVANGDPGRRIFLRDQCGGDSWTPFGGCLIDGPVERPAWLARVQETGSHPLWANSPVATSVETGTMLPVVNVGGRPHSFTRVANFGGGIIPILNTRDDTRIPAPECLGAIVPIPGAGGATTHTFTDLGEQHYQCCFHPWMRTTVNVTPANGN